MAKNIEITYSRWLNTKSRVRSFQWVWEYLQPSSEIFIFNDYVVNLHTKAEDNIDAYFKTNHIKADIVINTTEDINKLIGHID